MGSGFARPFLLFKDRGFLMEEAHTILHQISAILGIKQCTSTQVLGVCLEFWVGGLVSIGLIKIKDLLNIKKRFEELTSKPKPTKTKKKKKKTKKRKK